MNGWFHSYLLLGLSGNVFRRTKTDRMASAPSDQPKTAVRRRVTCSEFSEFGEFSENSNLLREITDGPSADPSRPSDHLTKRMMVVLSLTVNERKKYEARKKKAADPNVSQRKIRSDNYAQCD